MVEDVPLEKFYSNAVQFLRKLLHDNRLKLLTTRDFVVQKGELQNILQNKSVKHSGLYQTTNLLIFEHVLKERFLIKNRIS